MSEIKRMFYKTLNNIVATNRIDNEEAYILNNYISYLESALQQKENIIKEVREYINTFVELDNDIMLKGRMLKPALEILDKENK